MGAHEVDHWSCSRNERNEPIEWSYDHHNSPKKCCGGETNEETTSGILPQVCEENSSGDPAQKAEGQDFGDKRTSVEDRVAIYAPDIASLMQRKEGRTERRKERRQVMGPKGRKREEGHRDRNKDGRKEERTVGSVERRGEMRRKKTMVGRTVGMMEEWKGRGKKEKNKLVRRDTRLE
jgi:hypothetical protein